MQRITRALMGAALLVGAAAPAGAQTSLGSINFGTVCGGLAASPVCVASSAQLFLNAAGTQKYVIVSMQNLFGSVGTAHTVTGLGIYYTSPPPMSAGLGTQVAGPADWTGGFNNGGGALDNPGPDDLYQWLLASTAKVQDGLTGGPASMFRFDFAATDDIRIADFKLAFRSQETGPNGNQSVKCYTTDPATSAFACAALITTPEPATVALTATGLLGVFGVAFRRRRLVEA